jgi:hypothetical protein
MTDNNLKNTIDQHMKSLPDDVQEAIHGSSWERKILTIGRKYGLHVDQLEILQTELSLAVLGLTGRDEFVRETMHEARIDKQTMDLMILDINREIFEPIRNHLRKSREAVMERVDAETEKETSSGLHSDEEETLRRHGVSFDFDEEQVEQKALPVQVEKQEIVEAPVNTPQKTLTQPLVLKQKPGLNTNATSFEDLFPDTVNIDDLLAEDESPNQVTPINTSREDKVTPSIPGDTIDHSQHPVAKTEVHQEMINQSKTPIYTKGDPYREPII